MLVSSLLAGRAALQRAGRDIVASVLYVSNWAEIEEGRDYFASTASPSLLEHAWSLAVEEQLNLVEEISTTDYGVVEVMNIGIIACPVIQDGDWWFENGLRPDGMHFRPDEAVHLEVTRSITSEVLDVAGFGTSTPSPALFSPVRWIPSVRMDPPTVQPPRLGYEPGLDGLRAVAVSAVFLFHAGVLSGGFIGVDVFFVISGFLITSLIVSEIERNGRLALGAFWARRARRLLPAIYAVMAAAIVYSLWEGGAALRRIGEDVVATMFYVANWAQLSEGRDYFAQYEAEPLLEHTWSLAVEEQFYVVWPLIIAGLLIIVRRFGLPLRPAVAVAAACAAAASFAAALWLKGSGDASLTRLYYGTDTRAVGLAVGAVFGAMLNPSQIGQRTGTSTRRDLLGVTALMGLAAFSFVIDGSQTWLYGPGFLVIALLSVTAINAGLGQGHLARLLAVRPAVALGRVSYGVYLWHWPVIVVLDSERTGLSGLPLGLTWVAVTAALTTASWVLIESRAPMPSMQYPLRAVGYCGVALVLCGVAVVASRDAITRELDAEYVVPPAVVQPAPTSPPPPASPPGPTTSLEASDSAESNLPLATTGVEPASTSTTTTTLPFPPDRPLRVLILGDSVAFSLRDGPDPIPEQEIFDVEGYGAVEILNRGVIGCSIVDEGAGVFENGLLFEQPEPCRGDDRFAADVERFDPDLILTLFGWPGVGDRRFDDGELLSACDERFDREWKDDYRSLVERLQTTAPVVVANVAPESDSTAEEEKGARCLNALVADLGAPVLDYQGWLCPEYDCAVSASLRPDGIHFRNAGQLQRDVTTTLMELTLPIAGY